MNSLSIHTTEERRWAAGTHVASLLLAFLTSWAAGLAGMLGAAAVLLLKPANGSAFVEQHAKEAFNFNLSMFVYWLLGWILAGDAWPGVDRPHPDRVGAGLRVGGVLHQGGDERQRRAGIPLPLHLPGVALTQPWGNPKALVS